ncbi:glycosyltransferase family 2 protein [Patulibacter sp. NPDC049589]|uniref:glycosyltransferase family 2 protein n=1 Tax=Patulibacter sp. NPDC049589 TaxID=3154731 RepID=UPI0034221B89
MTDHPVDVSTTHDAVPAPGPGHPTGPHPTTDDLVQAPRSDHPTTDDPVAALRSDRPVDLSILIVTHRHPAMVRDCLASVYRETRGVAFEVLVLDSASGDGTAEMIAAEFPQVRLLAREDNVGFARGNNLLAREARGRHLLLLNPDTVVLNGALQRLHHFADEHPAAGLYGARTVTPDGDLDPTSCFGPTTVRSLALFASGLSTAFPGHGRLNPEGIGGWRRDTVREVGWLTGCVLLLPRALWDRLDGFDLRFWMYGEDQDLCLRARALGARPLHVPHATVVHLGGASSSSSGDKLVLIHRAKATVLRRHHPPLAARAGLALLHVGVALRAAGARVAAALGRPHATAWTQVWRDRATWRAGYGPGA